MFASIERIMNEAISYQDLGLTAKTLSLDNNLNTIS